MDSKDGRVADATGLSQAEPVPVSSLSGFDPSRKMLFARKEVCGALAMWAIRQSPYVIPDNLEAAITSMFEALPEEHDDWFFATEPQLREIIEFVCLNDQSIVAWNAPKSGHTAEYVFSSRYDGPAPDDDFIDLYALANNICETLLRDQCDYPSDSDGSPKGEDANAASSETTARAESIAQPQSGDPQ